MKFLGVLLDENMTWKNHVSCVENKISKNLGILYKARGLLNKKCMKQLYFSFVSLLFKLWKYCLGKYK